MLRMPARVAKPITGQNLAGRIFFFEFFIARWKELSLNASQNFWADTATKKGDRQ